MSLDRLLSKELKNSMSLLDTNDLKSYSKFLRSSGIDTNSSVYLLFKFFMKYHPDFEHIKVTKREAYKYVYGEKKYVDGTMRNLMVLFRKQLSNFLISKELNESHFLRDRLLMSAYGKRGMTSKMDELFKDVVRNTSNIAFSNSEQYFFIENYLKYNIKRARQDFVVNLFTNYLDEFIAFNKIRQKILLNSRKKVLGKKMPKMNFFSALNSYLESNNGKNNTSLNLLWRTSELADIDNKKDGINELLTMFRINRKKLLPNDQNLVFLSLTNEMTRILADGDIEYLSDLYELYRYGMANNLLGHEGKISIHSFLNVITIAIRSNDLAMSKHVLRKYLKHVPSEQKEIAALLAKALISSESRSYKDIKKDLKKLSKSYQEIDEKLNFTLAKINLGIALKNRKQVNWIQSYFKTLSKDLRQKNEELSTLKTVSFLHFSEIAELILTQFEKGAYPNLFLLQKKIESTSPLAGKSWLLQKIREM